MNYMSYFRYADEVSIGDEVLVQGNNGLTPTKVINVSKITLQGNHLFLTINLRKSNSFLSPISSSYFSYTIL